ncbi:MAG: hypothetical protein ACK5LC_01890, partial [Coprobacillaceae bacterium]
MIQLYFGNMIRSISTVLIITSFTYICYIIKNHNTYNQWGKTFIILFVIGLLMSIISGTRDAIGTPNGFPTQGALFIILGALGVFG